jgi:hypothetical protein
MCAPIAEASHDPDSYQAGARLRVDRRAGRWVRCRSPHDSIVDARVTLGSTTDRRARRPFSLLFGVLLEPLITWCGTRANPAARGRAVALRVKPLRVSPLSGCHPFRNTVRPAAPANASRAALPAAGDRVPFLSFASTRTTVPLDELTRCSRAARHFAALRSAARAALVPDRPPGHPPRPEPGRLNAEFARAGSTAAPVAALGSTSAAEAPVLVIVGGPLAAAVAPAELSRRPRLFGPSLRCGRCPVVPVEPTAIPPTAPPSLVRGT